MLGRRGGLSPEMQAMNISLKALIEIGIKYGFFPKNFSSINNPIADYEWRAAYDQTEDFEFISREKYLAENNSFKIDREALYRVGTSNHTIWIKQDFQDFMNIVLFSQLSFSGNVPELNYAFLKVFETIIREKIGLSDDTQKELAKLTNLDLNKKTVVNLPTNNCACPTNGLAGGTPPAKDKTWVKPLVVTAIIGTAVGVGLWKKDEIMKAITGKKTAVNGLDGTKRKRKTAPKKKKTLGQAPNKGLRKIKEITKIAKELQNKSGYEKRKVKEMEIRTVEREMPKLSWKDAQKKATYLVKNKNNPR